MFDYDNTNDNLSNTFLENLILIFETNVINKLIVEKKS